MPTGTFTCDAFNREFINSEAEPFHPTKVIERVHRIIPRFGRPSEIELLISGTTEGGVDYLTGIVSASIWIFSFFLIWMISMIVLRFMGFKHAGIYSGSRIQRPRPPPPPDYPVVEPEACSVEEADPQDDGETESDDVIVKEEGYPQESSIRAGDCSDVLSELNDNDALEDEGGVDQDADQEEHANQDYVAKLREWESRVQVYERQLRRMRITVLISGLVIVVSAVLMTVKGVESLDVAVGHTISGLAYTKKLLLEAFALLQNFLLRQAEFTAFRREVVNGFCPLVRQQICESLTPAVQNCTYDNLPPELIESIRSILETGQESLYSELGKMEDDLVKLAQDMDAYSAIASSFSWAFWMASAFSLLLAALTLILMYGVVLAWQGKLKDVWMGTLVRNWLIVPIYAFCVVMSWLFSMVFLIGAGLSADFCADSPDPRVLVRPNSLGSLRVPPQPTTNSRYDGHCFVRYVGVPAQDGRYVLFGYFRVCNLLRRWLPRAERPN
jgi:hypothetical protein